MPKAKKKKPGPPLDEVNIPDSEQANENIIEPQNTTNTMESYHPHMNHPKRNFKDYFSEFILIFVAITAGFFMENFREKIVDHQKEKEYMTRMITDLKEDTTNLKWIIQWNKEQITGLDSLSSLMEQPLHSIEIQNFLTLLTENLNDLHVFSSRDITMSQLKNTGGFRLIENSNVADSIMIYYNIIESSKILKDANYKFMEETFYEEIKFLNFNKIVTTGKLDVIDPDKMKELANRSFILKTQIEAYNYILNSISKQGKNLIRCLKNEYKVRN